MKTESEIQSFVKDGHKDYFPNLTIDCAIFGYHGQELKILLAHWKGLNGWSLPGGFIKRTETLAAAASRILEEKTSLHKVYLQQFHTFGDNAFRAGERTDVLPFLKGSWLSERTFSIGYYALVEFSKVNIETDFFFDDFKWEDVNKVGKLLFAHNDMIKRALQDMRLNLYHQPIGLNLLEKKFTLPEIQSLYETILGKELDRRNFPKKLMSLGLIEDTHEVRKIGQHRSPKLYTFNKKKYDEALKSGIVLVF